MKKNEMKETRENSSGRQWIRFMRKNDVCPHLMRKKLWTYIIILFMSISAQTVYALGETTTTTLQSSYNFPVIQEVISNNTLYIDLSKTQINSSSSITLYDNGGPDKDATSPYEAENAFASSVVLTLPIGYTIRADGELDATDYALGFCQGAHSTAGLLDPPYLRLFWLGNIGDDGLNTSKHTGVFNSPANVMTIFYQHIANTGITSTSNFKIGIKAIPIDYNIKYNGTEGSTLIYGTYHNTYNIESAC